MDSARLLFFSFLFFLSLFWLLFLPKSLDIEFPSRNESSFNCFGFVGRISFIIEKNVGCTKVTRDYCTNRFEVDFPSLKASNFLVDSKVNRNRVSGNIISLQI